MLIFAGCPVFFCAGPIRHSFNSPQPSSNSLGDACSGWIFPALTLTRHRGLATVICRLRAAPVFSFGMALTFCGCLLLVNLFPSNHLFLDRSGLRLVAGLGAQQFPDKTAQLSRHCHHGLVALESPRQKTRVATMQPVLSSPTDGPHLLGLTLLAPAQFLAHFGWASVMLGTLHQ